MIDENARLTISDPAPPRTSKAKQKFVPRTPGAPVDHVWVGSAEVWVPQAWPEMYPLVGQLVSEDLAWRVGTLEWQCGRPNRFKVRARAAWRAQGASLAAKRERLRATASELGFVRVPIENTDPWWKSNTYFRFA